MYTLGLNDFSETEQALLCSYLRCELQDPEINNPNEGLELDSSTFSEDNLERKIARENTPCEEMVADMYSDTAVTDLKDGMWKILKKYYVTWQLWSQTEREDLRDNAEKAFDYYIGSLIEKRNRDQDKNNKSDSTQTTGLIFYKAN